MWWRNSAQLVRKIEQTTIKGRPLCFQSECHFSNSLTVHLVRSLMWAMQKQSVRSPANSSSKPVALYGRISTKNNGQDPETQLSPERFKVID